MESELKFLKVVFNTTLYTKLSEGSIMNQLKLKNILESFLLEDVGEQDVTSTSIFPSDQKGTGVFVAKATGVIAGLAIIKEAYHLLDQEITIEYRINDGDHVDAGDVIAEVSGPVVHLLTGERVILNLLQRMSGIASMTRLAVDTLNDSSINICDTRKTTPGLRMLEKYAVTVGGGKNHRFGLYDGVMIKDNHIAFAGSITHAVELVRKNTGHMIKIEVETESKEDVIEAVEAGADIIMFDNRSPEEVKEFEAYVPSHVITEASGGIVLDTLSTYANTGVDYISLGFLTHSVMALDISLNVENF